MKTRIKTLSASWTDHEPSGLAADDSTLGTMLSEGWQIINVQQSTFYMLLAGQWAHTRTTMLRRDEAEAAAASDAVAAAEAVLAAIGPAVPADDDLIDEDDGETPPVPVPAAEPVVLEAKYRGRAARAFDLRAIQAKQRERAPKQMPPRKPIEAVSFIEALASGQYTPDELARIGDREALNAGRRVVAAMRERAAADVPAALTLPMLGTRKADAELAQPKITIWGL